MAEYTERFDADGDPIGCDACGYEAPLATFERFRKPPGELCEICASTFIGNAQEYPDQYPHRDVMFAIGWIGNHILSKMEKRDMKIEFEFDPTSEAHVAAVRALIGLGITDAKIEPVAAEPAEPVKPKRKRRTKAEIEADKKAAEAPDEKPKTDGAYDYAAARADLLKIRDAEGLGLSIVVKILKDVGVSKVDDLQEQPDLLPKVQELCAVALA